MTEEARIIDTDLPFAGAQSVVSLRSRAGFTVELTPGKVEQCAWIPKRRLATELDLQLQILRYKGRYVDVPPRILWRMQQGHGALMYLEPRLGTATVTGNDAVQNGWELPARGMRQRLATRELTCEFLLVNADDDDGTEGLILQCSFQPAHGAWPIVSPNTDVCGDEPGPPCVLPVGATEMRFCHPETGLPFAAGPTVRLFDLAGNTLASPALVSYATFVPIPSDAAFWGHDGETGTRAQAVYR